MSDIEKAYKEWLPIHFVEGQERVGFTAGWNASRAALIGEVEPVAWVQDLEYEMSPEFAFGWVRTQLHDKPLYTAEAIAAAALAERERCADLVESWLNSVTGAALASDCAAAILEICYRLLNDLRPELAAAVANERERAAKVCEARAITNDTPGALYARDCAAAIRESQK